MSESEEQTIPEEFNKIIKDFVSDILITFPEYQPIIDKWWKPQDFSQIEDADARSQAVCLDAQQKMQTLFDHCVQVFPERFFDILYQKTEIFDADSQVNTEFLPGISFKYLWKCEISDKTRETIWKYLQMVLISIIGSVKDKTALGDTSKLFDAINEDEFKNKLEETLGNMQNIFENMSKEEGSTDGESSTSGFNVPSADDIQGHLHGMMGGKLGDLAREIAEETAQDLNMDMEGVTDVKDVFQKLFSNPGKLMGMVKNVSEKLDLKMKSGEINQNELMTEASEMLNKMKNMPGMGNIQEMLGKMGMGGMGGMNMGGMNMGGMNMGGAGGMDMGELAAMAGLGRNTRINTGAMQQQADRLAKQEAFRNRIKKKMEAKNLAQLATTIAQQPSQQAPTISDEELFAMFSDENKPVVANSTGKKKKKKTGK